MSRLKAAVGAALVAAVLVSACTSSDLSNSSDSSAVVEDELDAELVPTPPPTTLSAAENEGGGDAHELVPDLIRPEDATPNPGGTAPHTPPVGSGFTMTTLSGATLTSGDSVPVGELIDLATGVGTFAPNTTVDFRIGNYYVRQFDSHADGSVTGFVIDVPEGAQGCFDVVGTDTAGTSVSHTLCVSS